MSLKRLKNGRWQVRWRDSTGKQRAENFRMKEQAQQKQRALDRGDDQRAQAQSKTLGDVIADWKRDRYPSLSVGTRVRYEKHLRLYFDPLVSLPLDQLTPAAIDGWIRWLKSEPNRFGKGSQRTSFLQELSLLRTVLSYYAEYSDDAAFNMPVKRRHRKDAKLHNRVVVKPQDLSEEDFLSFRQALEGFYGVEFAALVTLQFYNALRISEAAALRWEDIRFDWRDPKRSRIVFSQHVVYTHSSQAPSFIEPGLKNSEGAKEHPMLPEVFGMLRRLWRQGARGLIFQPQNGREFFSYRQIQFRYNRTFTKLGLPYTSTHVMRHGGTRKTFDETGGDEGIAAQQLGNKAVVKTYAKRSVLAFTRYAEQRWGSAPIVHSTGEEAKKAKESGVV